MTVPQLRAFARFLGTRWLAIAYRWEAHGLTLGLTAVNLSSRGFWYFWKSGSHVNLAPDGTVLAHLGDKDDRHLRALSGPLVSSRPELETQVALAIERSWRCFQEGDLAGAERAVGQVPESEVFVTPPARARSTRWWIVFTLATVLLFLALPIIDRYKLAWMEGLKPVSATESEIRAFLNDITPNTDPKTIKFNSPSVALFECLALPPTNLFSTEGLRAMRTEVFHEFGLTPQVKDISRDYWLCSTPLAKRAIVAGWIGWNDVGLKPQDVGEYIHHNQSSTELQFKSEFLLARSKAWSWVDNKGWDVERINDFTLNQLRWLRTVNCLDLIDREKLVRQIASAQVMSATPSPGHPPIHDWRDVRGLFFTPSFPALQDTYLSLASLEILGGLDKIDREACIEGILKRHRGKGYFIAPSSGGYNEYHIDGSVRDSIAAFEALRILGALDRVKDLDQWQFRVAANRSSKPAAAGKTRVLTWDEVEAWVCQQRLEQVLADHRQHAQAPVRTLLDP